MEQIIFLQRRRYFESVQGFLSKFTLLEFIEEQKWRLGNMKIWFPKRWKLLRIQWYLTLAQITYTTLAIVLK